MAALAAAEHQQKYGAGFSEGAPGVGTPEEAQPESQPPPTTHPTTHLTSPLPGGTSEAAGGRKQWGHAVASPTRPAHSPSGAAPPAARSRSANEAEGLAAGKAEAPLAARRGSLGAGNEVLPAKTLLSVFLTHPLPLDSPLRVGQLLVLDSHGQGALPLRRDENHHPS